MSGKDKGKDKRMSTLDSIPGFSKGWSLDEMQASSGKPQVLSDSDPDETEDQRQKRKALERSRKSKAKKKKETQEEQDRKLGELILRRKESGLNDPGPSGGEPSSSRGDSGTTRLPSINEGFGPATSGRLGPPGGGNPGNLDDPTIEGKLESGPEAPKVKGWNAPDSPQDPPYDQSRRR